MITNGKEKIRIIYLDAGQNQNKEFQINLYKIGYKQNIVHGFL